MLNVTHGRYHVEDDGIPMPGESSGDRVIEPGVTAENGAVINTGTFYGPVGVTVEVLDTAPDPAPDTAGWEQVEDVVLTAAGDRIGVFPPDDEPAELPELDVAPGSRYHVRVSVRGRDAGHERPQYDTGEAACEFHLVQLWPET
jgi:hypothetical protein